MTTKAVQAQCRPLLKCVAIATLFVAAGLHAQGMPAPDPDEEDSEPTRLELVEVIGTRLKRIDIEGPAPVDVFDQEAILETGAANLAEFFRSIPQVLGQSSDTAQTSGLAGADFINLRGIGVDNTLVLINGQRVAAYQRNGAAAPFVDVNAVPIIAIDRVEILKDGASALYGADAIAGVVNIVLRDSYEGLSVAAGYLTTGQGDGEEWNVDVAGGWQNDATSVSFFLSYLDKSPILSRDREATSDVDYSDLGGPNFRSFNGTPSTYFSLESFVAYVDPECGVDPNITNLAFFPFFGDWCLFNYAWFTQLTYDTNTLAGSVTLDHEFSPRLRGRAELLYNERDTLSLLAPTPVQGGFIPATHPNNPFGEALDIAGRPIDTGNRELKTLARSYRLVTGLEGETRRWNWSADLVLSSSKNDTDRLNAVLANRYYAALAGFGGPGGDQFYNPFGANPQNPPELTDWMTVDTRFGAEQTENSIELAADTLFGQLPGGPMGVAVGLQYREQKLDEFADEVERSGEVAGGAQVTQIDAERDVLAAFVEFRLPVLDKLEAQVAIRYDDFSDFGGSTNPKLALAWRPFDSLLLRASYSTSFRPPTFNELFKPETMFQGFYTDVERCNVTGASEDCAVREYPTVNVGNPDLGPEEGSSIYVGGIWSPVAFDGFDIEIAYWQFEHSERIILLSPQLVLDNESDLGITRFPPSPEDEALGIPGPIASVRQTYVNSDELMTDGFDAAVRYRWDTNDGSAWGAFLTYTYVNSFELTEDRFNPDGSAIDFAGGYFNFAFGVPKNRGNLTGNWQRKAHGVSATMLYTGRYEGAFPVTTPEGPAPWMVDDWMTFDLQYQLSLNGDRTFLRLGCRNCTDKSPPVTFNPDGDGLYDYRGSLWYARVEHSF